jgi:hypothetical protein
MLHSGTLWPYSQNIGQGKKGLPGKNTLAYYKHSSLWLLKVYNIWPSVAIKIILEYFADVGTEPEIV